ncbi:sulfotransferase [bacterium]|nr:sulfotransferase [bacterium]
MKKIFFQSSLPRSGSTLFQNIVGQNPDFYVTPTSGVLELVYAARGNYTNSPEFIAQDSELMRKGFLNFCHDGMLGFFNGVTDKSYVLDKSRGWGIHYNFLNSFYPDPKVVCLIRNPIDVFASMEKNFRNNQHKDSGIVSHGEMRGTTTEKRVEIWASSQPVGLAFERLYQIIREEIERKMLVIKYENLCKQPQVEMNRFYNYIGLPNYNHDFDNVEQITVEDDDVYGIYGNHTIRKKIQPLQSNAEQILGLNVCNWIRENYHWFYQYFNY